MRLTIASLLLVAATAAASPENGAIEWRTDFAFAQGEAKTTGKLLLLNFHTTWCGPCRALQQTTLKDPDLGKLITESAIPVSLDGDKEAALCGQLGVRAFPTQLFLTSDGQVAGKIEGYVSVADYTTAFKQALGKQKVAASIIKVSGDARTQGPVVAQPRPAPPRELPPGMIADRTKASPPLPLREPPGAKPKTMVDPDVAPVALDGHCPVTMVTRAELVKGAKAESTIYEGRRYLFLSARERAQFLRNPKAYLPGGDGYCVVTLCEAAVYKPGRVDLPALFNEKVYLFSSEDARTRFLADPEKYVDAKGNVKVPPNLKRAPTR